MRGGERMIKLIDKLMKGIECLVTILLGLEVVVIVAQIFFRYVLRRPLSWSDQACRFGLVWIIMLGVPVMFHRKSTVSFDLIIDFKADSKENIKDEVVKEIKEKYPDYDYFVILDTDFSD